MKIQILPNFQNVSKGGFMYVEVEPVLCLSVHLMSSQIIQFRPLFALCVTIELAPLPHALSPLLSNFLIFLLFNYLIKK